MIRNNQTRRSMEIQEIVIDGTLVPKTGREVVISEVEYEPLDLGKFIASLIGEDSQKRKKRSKKLIPKMGMKRAANS